MMLYCIPKELKQQNKSNGVLTSHHWKRCNMIQNPQCSSTAVLNTCITSLECCD